MDNLKEELYALLSFEKSQDANFNDGALYEWIRDGKTYVSKLSPDQIESVIALFESYVKACKPEKVADNIGNSSSVVNWGKRLGYNEGVDEYEKALLGGK